MTYIDFEKAEKSRRLTGSAEQMHYLWADLKAFTGNDGDVLVRRRNAAGALETMRLSSKKAASYKRFPTFD